MPPELFASCVCACACVCESYIMNRCPMLKGVYITHRIVNVIVTKLCKVNESCVIYSNKAVQMDWLSNTSSVI